MKTDKYAINMHKYRKNPVDMFTWTAHVETVVLMSRVDK